MLRALVKKLPLLSTLRNTTRSASQAVRPCSTETDDFNIFKVGHTLHGFEVKNVEEVPEFRLTAIHLVHDRTHAEYLHLFRNDNNNVFSINFRTTPMNSSGLPHILEHTALCGSKSFPVRDPFFRMLNRSLATFMNAMTGSDYTIYPFSTQNLLDYRNLQKVYLDAVFRPNLKELDFMQEGWRLENADPANIQSPLVIKGVVYNEMKGVFSENDNIFAQKLQNLILPDHTYGVISGGAPAEIPSLTWDDLKAFHCRHYHPSNARFYSYGNFSLSSSLEYINTYLAHYEAEDSSHTKVPSQRRWSLPVKEHIFGRFETMKESIEKQNTVAISLLLSDITHIYETFLMQFVAELLIRGPNSPFYKSMIEPNFSSGFTPTTGYDTQSRDSIFTIGLSGLKKDDFERVITLFDGTLDEVIEKGFEADHIESVLHRYELSIKHETSNFGLNILFGVTPTWNHSGDVLASLQVNRLIEKLRNNMKQDSKYLQDVVKRAFKDNTHRLVLSMSPDKEYEAKQVAAEEALIRQKTADLCDADREAIFKKGIELLGEQSKEQNSDVLPCLFIDDISNTIEKVTIDKVAVNSVPIQVNKVNSNGVVYFKGLLNTTDLSPEQQMLLPLFSYVITKLGTAKLDYRKFDSLMNTKSAGLEISPMLAESLFQLHNYEPNIYISSYCLEKNVDAMWDLWGQIFNISKLDDIERFKMLCQLYMSNLTNGIADSGHIYAMQAAAGLVSGTSYQNALLTGLSHISYMKRLIATGNFKAVLDEIVNIAHIIFAKHNLRVAFNVLEESQSKVLKSFTSLANNLPNSTKKQSEHSYVEGKIMAPLNAINCQHHVLNIPVNYCSKAILTAPYSSPDYAKLGVLARLLSAKYLHPELREKQGAYGAGARMTRDGVFCLYTYRDPRNVETLDVFDDTSKWLDSELGKITPQAILEAKLGVFQAVDAPVPPSFKGCDEFLRRLTPELLQRHRAELMSVTLNDLKAVGEKYLKTRDTSLIGKVVLGPSNEKINAVGERSNEMWTVMDNE